VGATTTATLARVGAYDVTIARVHRGLSTGPQQLTLRVPRRLIGHAQRFTLRLIVTGTTRAGNRTTASWKLTVAGAGRSTRHR
jgi:hypothetical protein